MQTYTATGMTLLVRKYKGSERIATFYSRERGKIEAVAKGIGKPGSTLAPAVEMFALSKLFLVEGRELDRLTQCEVVDSFYELRQDMTRYGHASYVAELVVKTTEVGEANEGLFEALIEALQAMRTAEQPEPIAWAFALTLLDMLGIGPVTEACVLCGAHPVGDVGYSPQEGGVICGKCRPAIAAGLSLGPPTLSALRGLKSFPIGRVARIAVGPPTAREIRRLVQMHISYHLGIELKSQAFLEEMGAR